jgi:hypothetical protein
MALLVPPMSPAVVSASAVIGSAGGSGRAPAKVIFLTTTSASNQTWTVPSDWNSSNNTVEVIASGGGGATGNGNPGSGGGGGGYSKQTNIKLTPGGSATYRLSAGGAADTTGGDAWFNGTTLAGSSVGAKGGVKGVTGTSAAGGAGGEAASGIGTTKKSGGTGGATDADGYAGGGGGGGGGPNGAGAAGGNANTDGIITNRYGGGGGGNGGGSVGANATASAQGNGGNNFSGTGGGTGGGGNGSNGGGAAGGNASSPYTGGGGGNGIDWNSTHGSGGGGGGAGGETGTLGAGGGGDAGNYGAGGGGGAYGGIDPAGVGAQALIVITYTPASIIPISNGLVGYWPLDGSQTNWSTNKTNDLSGNGNTGQMLNFSTTTSPTIGKIGSALKFVDANSTGINVGTPSSLNLTGDLTISAWIKPSSFGGSSLGRIFDKSNGATAGYSLRVDNSGVSNGLAFETDSGSGALSNANAITLNEWQFVTVVFNSGTGVASFYVNGVAVGSGSPAGGAPADNSSIAGYIGRRNPDTTRNFDGAIDDVRVYNRALTATEIRQLYGVGAVNTGLTKRIFLTITSASNQTWTVPSDWNSSNNTVEVIAAGGGGEVVSGGPSYGGGGGAYSKVTNVVLTPGGTATYRLSAGGAGANPGGAGPDAWFNGTTLAGSSVGAKGGSGGTTGAAGAGGVAASGIGSIKYSGGTGGTSINRGGGGGGAAGPNGDAGDGGNGGGSVTGGGGGGGNGGGTAGSNNSGSTGGNGGDNSGGIGHGTGGTSGNPGTAGTNGGGGGGGGAAAIGADGGDGTEWDSTHGSGGGGGGEGAGNASGGNGGLYGAGGGGAEVSGGAGGQALIVITYIPKANAGHTSSPTTNSTKTALVSSGLIGHWTFDGGNINWRANTTSDTSGQGNTGRLTSFSTTTSPVAGKIGQALKFSGSNTNYVQISGLMGSPSSVTLAGWAKVASTTAGSEVVSIGDYVALRLDSTGNGATGIYYDGTVWRYTTSGAFYVGKGWHHFVYTNDTPGKKQTLYIDGAVASSSTKYTGAISYSGQGSNTFIGHHGNGQNNFNFQGLIDDVRIYNRALTANEVNALYQAGK